jgi:hypothetical protein
MAASGLLAWLAISKFVDHLPLYRIGQIGARQDVPLPMSTTADWIGKVGVALQPLADRMSTLLRLRPALHADETPVRQLDPGKGKTKRAYLWAYRSNSLDEGPLIVVFDYQGGRGGVHAQTFLGDWRGHLMVDDFSGYVVPKFMLRRRARVMISLVAVDSCPHIKKTAQDLNVLQKRHQRGQCDRTAWPWRQSRDIDAGKRLRLHLQVYLGVNICRVQGHMPQPGPDRVDVNASAQQVNRRRVAHQVRTDALILHRRD